MLLGQLCHQVNTLQKAEGGRKSRQDRIILGCGIMGLLAKLIPVNVLTARPPSVQTAAYQCAYALSVIMLSRSDH